MREVGLGLDGWSGARKYQALERLHACDVEGGTSLPPHPHLLSLHVYERVCVCV